MIFSHLRPEKREVKLAASDLMNSCKNNYPTFFLAFMSRSSFRRKPIGVNLRIFLFIMATCDRINALTSFSHHRTCNRLYAHRRQLKDFPCGTECLPNRRGSRTSFPHAFGGNPGSIRPLDPRQKPAGVTICKDFKKQSCIWTAPMHRRSINAKEVFHGENHRRPGVLQGSPAPILLPEQMPETLAGAEPYPSRW